MAAIFCSSVRHMNPMYTMATSTRCCAILFESYKHTVLCSFVSGYKHTVLCHLGASKVGFGSRSGTPPRHLKPVVGIASTGFPFVTVDTSTRCCSTTPQETSTRCCSCQWVQAHGAAQNQMYPMRPQRYIKQKGYKHTVLFPSFSYLLNPLLPTLPLADWEQEGQSHKQGSRA